MGINTLRKNLQKAGYSQEEAYFFDRDRELIRNIKERPKLRLIQGGGGSESSRPTTSNGSFGKKAA